MKRNLILFFLLALLGSTTLQAYDAKIDGIYYNFSGDEATVTSGRPKYTGAVVIPSSVTYNSKTYSVTSIGYMAFDECSSLTSITIPNSVTSIGDFAFQDCRSLTSVTIPNSVTSIGNYAFRNCKGLTSITIPNSVTSIGDDAFKDCSSLTSIIIPNGVTSIGSYAFGYCSSLSSVTIPNSVTSIDNSAFSGCYFATNSFINNSSLTSSNNWGATLCDEETSDGLLITDNTIVKCRKWATIVTIPHSVTSIGNSAFAICTGLTSITIPNSLISIGDRAFSNCTSLTSVHILDLEAWCKFNFKYAYSNPLYYAHHLFLNGEEITDLVIPNSVTGIGEGAFEGCSSLTSVTIPNSVTSIGSCAFRYCTGLTSITIPNSVISIDEGVFSGCSSLTSFTLNCPYVGSEWFMNVSSIKEVTLGETVTRIEDYAFQNCTNLVSATIGSGVKSIGSSAFKKCKLRNLLIKCTIPPSIGSETFSEKSSLHTTLYVPLGSWDAYAYDDDWYKFINIRETATTEEQVSMQQAYTLMDAESFTYSVYDPVNDCIGTISSAGINEDNPNHSWQVIETGGSHYLYNVGAKKFAVASNGSYTLSDEATPINMENGENGIIFGAQANKQWALVCNESMSVDQSVITGISLAPALSKDEGEIYNLAGQRLNKMQKGISIVGSKKVLIK